MRLVFGGHFWQGIKVGRGLSLQFSGELANVLCIIQSVASYALLLLHYVQGGLSMMWFISTCCRGSRSMMWFFATIFGISRLARLKFKISISMTSQLGSRHHWRSTLCYIPLWRSNHENIWNSPPAMYIYLFDPPKILKENKASNESSLTSRDIGHM